MDDRLNFTAMVDGGNSTPFSPGPHFVVYKVLLLALVAIPITIMDGSIIILLITEKGINPILKAVLANMLFARMLVISALITESVVALSLVGLYNASDALPTLPSTSLCAFIAFVSAIGSSGRHMVMAVFSTSVLTIVRYGMNKLRLRYFVIVIILLWIGSTTYQAALFSPHVAQFEYYNSITCLGVLPGVPPLTYIILYLFIFCTMPYAVTIITAALTCCYTQKNTSSTELPIGRAMVKFSLFLTVGNTLCVISIVSVAVPSVILSSSLENEQLAFNMIMTSSILLHFSLVPFPFLLIAYFAPLRAKVLWLLRCCFVVPLRRVYTSVFTSQSPTCTPTTEDNCKELETYL